MKVSLRWIFDHIKHSIETIDIGSLVDTFIRTTAEIESWKKVTLNSDNFTLVEVTHITDEHVIVYSHEHKKEYILPQRFDAVIGSLFLIADIDSNNHWATSLDCGGQKNMLFPALDVPLDLKAGEWKKQVEWDDYIIEIDNKSINSRPDLWGHRGIAREIAAILNLMMYPLEQLIVEKNSVANTINISSTDTNPFAIHIKSPLACSRFAMLYISSCEQKASLVRMAFRLHRIDSKAINFFIDATNYVMLDMGQPMHAFNANAIHTKSIIVRYANDKEKITLLDDQTIELTNQDLIIADENGPISLAGIMGGSRTAITQATTAVLLEAAHFEPATIRRSAVRHKKRTESSMRFEKNLDPHQNNDAIKRFLFLLNDAKIKYTACDTIVSLGTLPQPKIISVLHSFIESRLGIIISIDTVVSTLKKLFFEINQSVENSAVLYTITVPSFRATKDIKIPEDIVEEIGRFIGYDSIPRVMPSLQLKPKDLSKTYTTRSIKQFLSYGLSMRELYSYSFFDESMLKQLQWLPTNYVPIKNPISENYTRLITTLQPYLLKAVMENSIAHPQLRFFELGRIWHINDDNIIEQKSLSGIFFDQRGQLDFYAGKNLLLQLFSLLQLPIIWQEYSDNSFNWYDTYKTAKLMHEGVCVGTAGVINDDTVSMISAAGGSAFIFELNADYLLQYKKPFYRFDPLSKYPSVHRDISILIKASATTTTLINCIKDSSSMIESIELIDFFSKSEWKDQKAMTFRVTMGDKEKTLHSDEVEIIIQKIIAQLEKQEAIIR